MSAFHVSAPARDSQPGCLRQIESIHKIGLTLKRKDRELSASLESLRRGVGNVGLVPIEGKEAGAVRSAWIPTRISNFACGTAIACILAGNLRVCFPLAKQ